MVVVEILSTAILRSSGRSIEHLLLENSSCARLLVDAFLRPSIRLEISLLTQKNSLLSISHEQQEYFAQVTRHDISGFVVRLNGRASERARRGTTSRVCFCIISDEGELTPIA